MKLPLLLFAGLFVFILPSHPALAQISVAQSQAEAVRQFPDLAKEGSAFNTAFLAKLEAARAAQDPILNEKGWPMSLARVVAIELALPQADISKDGKITLAVDTPLQFKGSVYRTGRKGEQFTAHSHDATSHRTYIIATDHAGKPIGLNVADSALALKPPLTTSTPAAPATPAQSSDLAPRSKGATESQNPEPSKSEANLSGVLSILGGIVVGTLVLAFLVSAMFGDRAKRKARLAELMKEAEEFHDHVTANGSLPIIDTGLMLKDGESAVYEAASCLYETRAVRHYAGARASIRIAKGFWVGGSQGRSISTQEWSMIDSGRLIMTNERLIFDGENVNRNLILGKIIATEMHSIDSIAVSVESRQKSMVFQVPNPIIARVLLDTLCRSSS